MNNINYNARSALDGTKTAENLRRAFGKEAENFAKGIIYAALAANDGDISAQRTITEHADNDRRHAELWLGYLDELGDTLENLSELSSLKSVLGENLYPAMAEIAKEEGFDEIAEKMRLVSAVKDSQTKMLKDESERIKDAESVYSDDPETIWHCSCCGYDIKGNMPPERCPLCSYPSQYFKRS